MVYIFYPSAAFLPHQIRLSGAKPPFTLIFQQRKIQENRADKNRGVLFPYQIQNHNSTLQSSYTGVTFKYRGVRYFLRTYSTVLYKGKKQGKKVFKSHCGPMLSLLCFCFRAERQNANRSPQAEAEETVVSC